MFKNHGMLIYFFKFLCFLIPENTGDSEKDRTHNKKKIFNSIQVCFLKKIILRQHL
jgi:hypothetical protein